MIPLFYCCPLQILLLLVIVVLQADLQNAFVISTKLGGLHDATAAAASGSVTTSLYTTASSDTATLQTMPLPNVVSFLNSIITNQQNQQLQSQQFFLEALQRENITRIATHGYITHRRSFGSSLAFIDLVDGIPHSQSWTQTPLQALLKTQDYHHHRTKSSFASILKCLYPGTKVYLEGVPCGTRNPGEVVLLVQYLRFEMCSRNPQHVKGLLMKMSQSLLQNVPDESLKVGLCIEEVVHALGPNINGNALKYILKGEQEVIDGADGIVEEYLLYPPGMQQNTTSNGVQPTGNILAEPPIDVDISVVRRKNMVPFESMARSIVKNLPQDLNYPFELLSSNQKGTSSRSQGQYKTWFRIPEDVKEPPFHIRDTLQKSHENEVSREISIQTLLDEVVASSNNKKHNDDNGTNVKSHANMTMDLITIEGWIENRKRFQGSRNESITILELVDEIQVEDEHHMSDLVDCNRLKCVLHPDCCLGGVTHRDEVSPSHAYGHLLGKGSKVILQGYCCITNQRPIFWVRNACLARCTSRPSIVKYFLDLIAGSDETGKYSFRADEIASALDIGHQKAESLVHQCRSSDATERQWLAAKISRKLQSGTSRYGLFTDEMKQVIDQFASLRNDYPLEKIERDDITSSRNKFDNVQMLRRTALLKQSSEGSRWRSKKRPQLEFMAQQVKEVIESHADFGSRPLNILDVGGGRGYLSNYLSGVLGSDVATIHVIDIDSRAIKNGLVDAKRKGLMNVHYGVGDASSTSEVAKLVMNETNPQYDIIVALHACGALSDVALGHAVSNEASFVITPCCFLSNPFLRVALPSQSEREEKILMRSYEWLGLEENSMVALSKAAEVQGDIKAAGEAIHTLCALRAMAVKRYWSGTNSDRLDIRIKTFPIEFSTRNYCIVGKIASAY